MALTKEQMIRLQNNFFVRCVTELIDSLMIRFGENESVSQGLLESQSMVQFLSGQTPDKIQQAIQMWAKATTNGNWMMQKDPGPLLDYAREHPLTPILGQLNLEYLLLSPEAADAQDAIWARLQNITKIASSPETYPGLGAPATNRAPFTPTQFTTPSSNPPLQATNIPQPVPPVMDAKKMVQAIKTNLPAAMEAFKEIMGNKDDNPLQQILQAIKNPKSVNSDIGSNLMGMMTEAGIEPSVMEETEKDVATVSRLDNLEESMDEVRSSVKSIEKMLKKMSTQKG